jgi:diguanylate cyclase (GGDEF)-like protein
MYEVDGKRPYPSVADVLFLLFYVFMLCGLLRFAVGRRNIAERVRLGLDLAVVAIGSSAVVLYVVLGPTAVAGSPSLLQAVFSIAYPVGDMVLLIGLASVLLRDTTPSARRSLQLIAAGLILYVAGDLIYGYITLHSVYHGGDPVDTFYMVAIALFAVAAAAQQSATTSGKEPVEVTRHRATWAPYTASAVGFGLLIVVDRHDPFFPNLSLAITAVSLAALVSVRQFLAQHDLLRTQGQLSHQSLHDALTGLPNRILVLDRGEQILARSRRLGVPATALFMDIDGFKQINERYGHQGGDEVLKRVAARLRSVMREGDTVGRLGGDEFVMLLDCAARDVAPELIAERILVVVRQPIELTKPGRSPLSVTASIGIATTRPASAEDLLQDADLALYEAKAAGKDGYAVFESAMQVEAQDQIDLESDLADALAGNQFFLAYQPILDLGTERVVGVEALLRWRHPTRGVIAPDVFIPIAEANGLIVRIGRWVLAQACAQAATWRRDGYALDMSVNVSARQLEHDEFITEVQKALDASGLDPATLILEITETVLMRKPDATARLLRELNALGVRIAVDDFGTGYSSLAYLRRFSVDSLKIDRSFIKGLEIAADTNAHFPAGALNDGAFMRSLACSNEAQTLTHTLIQLGKALGIRTLAEGVEQPSQVRQLQHEGCDLAQGFLFAQPLTPQAVAVFLDERARGCSQSVGWPSASATEALNAAVT